MDRYISQLKNGDITRGRIPEDVKLDDRFILAERKAKTRFWDRRGYDVINNNFFVIEKLLLDLKEDRYSEKKYVFETFEEFYAFLQGDIYNNSSYYQFTFSDVIVNTYNLDISKLANTHFIDDTIDSFKIDEYFKDKFFLEDKAYQDGEKNKKNILKWVDRLCDCKTLEAYTDVYKKYSKSKFKEYADTVNALVIKRNPDIIFEYLINTYNSSGWYELSDIEPLFGHYDTEKINDAVVFDKHNFYFSANTFAKRKRRFKALLDKLRNLDNETDNSEQDHLVSNFLPGTRGGFSSNTHFYTAKRTISYGNNDGHIRIFDVFFSFDEFTEFLNNDLSGCDLSETRLNHIDFGKYKTDADTILPKEIPDVETITTDKFKYEVTKKYDNGYFKVSESWEGLGLFNHRQHSFDYFGDFVYFLNGDLSNADFSLCPNLVNLQSIIDLNINNTVLQSNFCDKFNIQYATLNMPSMSEFSFVQTNKNEEETGIVLSNKNELVLSLDERSDYIEIAYISDIHLLHMFENRACKTEIDCNFVISEVTESLSDFRGYLVLGGDIASDYSVFERFIERLSISVPSYSKSDVIFILGNHELWGLEKMPLSDIINKYRKTIEKHGFRFLQNGIMYESINDVQHEIDEAEIMAMSVEELRKELKDARLVFYGGIGFSGLNEDFNANNGIYRTVLSRSEEKQESLKFEMIYEKVCEAARDRNLIVLSHMPKQDWTNGDYKNDVVYINGHNHKNYFWDEDGIRIYADNQIGYNSPQPFLKKFYIDKEFDWFSDYDDNIHEITIDQYRDFYRAKNIQMNCNREGQYYMLKKNNYYCFMFYGRDNFSRRTGLFLLNGGQLSTMLDEDLGYYYNHMDEVISIVRKPLDKYSAIQNKIANQIKDIGGSGFIHGTIIDIDYNNHIYVNRNDLTITAYWASSMVNKLVYKNIPSLLKAECPSLYGNYVKLIESNKENALVVKNNTEIDLVPIPYYETDIYKDSRKIKKMQRVNKGILTTWPDENLISQHLIED